MAHTPIVWYRVDIQALIFFISLAREVPVQKILAAILFLIWTDAAAEPAPLKVILLPYTNTVSLMKIHQPLRLHLQAALDRPVELFTSMDFPSHFDSVRLGDFDVAITGPHFGAWAVKHGHQPLLRYSATLTPVLAVRSNSGITGPQQVRGKVVIMSNRFSSSSLAGVHWLKAEGLDPERDYTLRVSPTHTAAIMAVAMGEADAAITTHTPIRQAPEDIREKVVEVSSPISFPHLFTIANANTPKERIEPLIQAFASFETTETGRRFFEETGYQGYSRLSAADIEAMRPFVDLLMKTLASP
jgi:phosphonate transport system substrate-binding protein